MKYAFGIDLGGTTVKMAFFSLPGTCLHKWEIPTNTENNGSHILPDIADAVLAYMAQHNIDAADVVGLGIGVPGPVRSDGTVNGCVNLGWGKTPVANILRELTGLLVKAGNDANVAALGENWQGGGKGYGNMVMVTFGTGVGGGVVVGGHILHGAHGAGGEIGHMVLNREETETCGCGKRGCAEQYCSATGIVRTCKQYLSQTGERSTLCSVQSLTCRDIFDAAKDGDAVAQSFLEIVYDRMAELIANVCCVADPSAVVIGGGVSKAGQILIDGIGRHLPKYLFYGAAEVQLVLAELGNDAGVWGACALALENVR